LQEPPTTFLSFPSFSKKRPAAAAMDEGFEREDRRMSAVEEVKKRHHDKGFFYAWSVRESPQASYSMSMSCSAEN
jgi:hypothetical protein